MPAFDYIVECAWDGIIKDPSKPVYYQPLSWGPLLQKRPSPQLDRPCDIHLSLQAALIRQPHQDGHHQADRWWRFEVKNCFFLYLLFQLDSSEQLQQKSGFKFFLHLFSVEIMKKTAIPDEGHIIVECKVTLIPSGSGAGNQVTKLQAKRSE